jgi:hypothetical protein
VPNEIDAILKEAGSWAIEALEAHRPVFERS